MGSRKSRIISCQSDGSLRQSNGIVPCLTRIVNGIVAVIFGGPASPAAQAPTPPPFFADSCLRGQFSPWAGFLGRRPALISAG